PPLPQGESRTFSFFSDVQGGYLGVQTEDVTKENFGKYGLREIRGVAVEKVNENSPAAAAGIQAGDVIIRLNGEEITSMRKLTRLVGESAPDRQVKITLLRGGYERVLTATLGRPQAPGFVGEPFRERAPGRQGRIELSPLGDTPSVETLPSQPWFRPLLGRSGSTRQIGIGVTSLTIQLADHFGVAGGVLINIVSENSPAAKAGLRAGDIIVEVDGKSVGSDFDLMRAIAEKKEGEVALIIVRDRSRQTILVTPEEVKISSTRFRDSAQW
ncbi:MAG: PDZ domain-containing protein, partial [Acidobacteria bacterium]|nr:PDZ domain-containing protein [Acidobacteriota bacterium]